MPDRNREIRLRRRPAGIAARGDFELTESAVPAPAAGEVLVRTLYLSAEPYLRIRTAHNGDLNPGDVLPGTSVGEVAASGHPDFGKGDIVVSQNGYREWFVSDGKGLEKVDTSIAPARSYAGTLGIAGLTAWSGVTHALPLKPGQKVFVSSAAGCIGHIVCQVAKMKGCHVVGSTSTDEKCRWLTEEIGIVHTINYRRENLNEALASAFPTGIDYYFDNVGGDHLSAAINNMADFGSILICGLVQQYGSDAPPPFTTTWRHITARRLTIQGFSVYQHLDKKAQFLREMTEWQKSGNMRLHETIIDGIENAVEAFFGLYEGKNSGKMLVRIAPDAA